MNLYDLFTRCIEIPYTRVDNSGDYAVERTGNTLNIYLESSNGVQDWQNNFDFPVKSYKNMDGRIWYVHKGFLRVWKSIEPCIKSYLDDPTVQSVVITGFSHGGALSVLCHEYVWYNYPHLRKDLYGYAFGAPRVLWGIKTKDIKSRFENFTVIRNLDDAVTHLPPRILGYYHVGKLVEIGQKGNYSSVDAHRPENYISELGKLYEK